MDDSQEPCSEDQSDDVEPEGRPYAFTYFCIFT